MPLRDRLLGGTRTGAWLDARGRERIERAVRDAERGTRGEIVVSVVRACDEYSAAGWRAAALLALVAGLGLGAAAPGVAPSAVVAAGVAAAAAGHALARLPAVRRRLVGEAELEACAQRRAFAAFAEHGVHHTSEATGILVLVALFEHRVVVLADEGVNRRLDPGESWDEVVALALAGIRRGDLVEGLVAAVARCGEILAHPLPPRDEPRDEIRAALVVEE